MQLPNIPISPFSGRDSRRCATIRGRGVYIKPMLFRSLTHSVTVRQTQSCSQNNRLLIHACLGSTFEFRRKKLVGSYLFLRATKREWLLPKTASAVPLPA